MDFQFIDGTHIDASARKKIRSSVMRGRNAGKKRPRREPARPLKPRVLIPDVAGINRRATDGDQQDSEGAISHMLATVGNEFESLRYPRPLEPYMQRIVREFMQLTNGIIYPKELCTNVEVSHTAWFGYFQSDEAFFHCILAMAQAFTDWARGGQGESIKVMRYLADTYRCINEKIRLESTPDDATVAVVMSMTMHSNLLRAPGGAKVHLNALQRMIELRGGLTTFPTSLLLHKICRTDIEFSLQSGSPPRFYRDEFPYSVIRSSHIWPGTAHEAFFTSMNAQIYDLVIQTAFRDVLCASKLINTMEITHQKLQPFMFQEILISIGYRLMRAYPLNDVRPLSAADDSCQLALLALVSTMFIGHNSSKLPYKFMAGLFRDAISRLDENLTANENFLLWLLFVAGISVLEIEEDLLLKIRRCITALGLGSWQAVKIILQDYPWITYFHDRPGLQLWNMLTGP